MLFVPFDYKQPETRDIHAEQRVLPVQESSSVHQKGVILVLLQETALSPAPQTPGVHTAR